MPVKMRGELTTVEIRQDGPIAYLESTTLAKVFDEDENRMVSLYTDEGSDQSRRVVTAAARAAAGKGRREDVARVLDVHRTAQRMLLRLPVVVPFAERLGENIPDDRVEVRRAFPHLLGMISASALLHQFQRERTGSDEVVATRYDYELASALLSAAMRRLLGGGLSPAAQRFYGRLRDWFHLDVFTSSDARWREKSARGSVRTWLLELCDVGAVELVEAGRGPQPWRWRAAEVNVQELGRSVLPKPEKVFDEQSPA